MFDGLGQSVVTPWEPPVMSATPWEPPFQQKSVETDTFANHGVDPYDETESTEKSLRASQNRLSRLIQKSQDASELKRSIQERANSILFQEVEDVSKPMETITEEKEVVFVSRPKRKRQMRKKEKVQDDQKPLEDDRNSKKQRIFFEGKEKESIPSHEQKFRSKAAPMSFQGEEEEETPVFRPQKSRNGAARHVIERKRSEDLTSEMPVKDVNKEIKLRRTVFSDAGPSLAIGPRQEPASLGFDQSHREEFGYEQIESTRFSQREISYTLYDGTLIFNASRPPKRDDGLAALYRKQGLSSSKRSEPEVPTFEDIIRTRGWDNNKTPLFGVQMPDGIVTSFDNRRLALMKALGQISHSVRLQADIHDHREPANENLWAKVAARKEETPRAAEIQEDSVGHTLMARITNQGEFAPSYGYDNFPVVRVATGALSGRRNNHKRISLRDGRIVLE